MMPVTHVTQKRLSRETILCTPRGKSFRENPILRNVCNKKAHLRLTGLTMAPRE